MGATFPRVKVWSAGEDVTHTDLNAEFQNVLDNLTPAGADDYSSNATQMQIQTDPGSVGSELLATSTAGEIARLRYAISRIIGGTYWYSTPPQSLTQLNALTAGRVPQNRIVSGRVRSATDGFPIFLAPDGTAATVTLKGATTNFNIYINNSPYVGTSDVTRTGLTPAPAANNTCLVNDAVLASQAATKYVGEVDAQYPTLTIDTVGSEISALVGKYAAFKVGAEYFVAFVKSATQLTNAYRGAFFNSSDAPVVRVTLADNDTVTLCKLHWIYYKTDGTLASSATNPIFASDTPASPSTGDYWYDLTNQQWKLYDGASWGASNSHLIGWAVCDTAGCKAARSFDYYAAYSEMNTAAVELVDAATVRVVDYGAQVAVAGSVFSWDRYRPFWGMSAGIGGTSDIESGFSENSSTDYWFYVTERGDLQISPERPYDRRTDLYGYYHPYHTWRALGYATNDGSSNLTVVCTLYNKQPNYAISSSCTVFSTSSTSYVDITNLSVTIKTRGRPVLLSIVPESSSNNAAIGQPATNIAEIKWLRDSTTVATCYTGIVAGTGYVPLTQQLDFPGAGTFTYKLQYRNAGGTVSYLYYLRIVAVEL